MNSALVTTHILNDLIDACPFTLFLHYDRRLNLITMHFQYAVGSSIDCFFTVEILVSITIHPSIFALGISCMDSR